MSIGNEDRPCWFVGAIFNANEDQTSRFLRDGIWENGYDDKYLDLVKTIKTGDRIAIKSSYTRKHKLPFDNRGQSVSVMGIKAVGSVTENIGDGRRIEVDWTSLDSPKEWYFYTHRGTIWRVNPGEWETDALIAFTFDDKPQDIDRFRNAPFWRERFGDDTTEKRRFQWTRFYTEVANTFEGIPILNNQKSWFFSYEKNRNSDDIDQLWNIFEEAIRFADSDDAEPRSGFSQAYDKATMHLL